MPVLAGSLQGCAIPCLANVEFTILIDPEAFTSVAIYRFAGIGTAFMSFACQADRGEISPSPTSLIGGFRGKG
jgi:hypothetical protein